MAAKLIDGHAVAGELRQRLAASAASFAKQHGAPPGLAAVLVGDDPARWYPALTGHPWPGEAEDWAPEDDHLLWEAAE